MHSLKNTSEVKGENSLWKFPISLEPRNFLYIYMAIGQFKQTAADSNLRYKKKV